MRWPSPAPSPPGPRRTIVPCASQDASDEWLAGRAARGDTAAFEQLVLRHQDRLYTLALRVTLNEADARDCVQEGLISAWRSMARFRGDAKFSTWMYRIVMRKAYDALDKRKRTPQPVDELPLTVVEPQIADRLDLDAALAAARARLPRGGRCLRRHRPLDGRGRRGARHPARAPSSPGCSAPATGWRSSSTRSVRHERRARPEIARLLREQGQAEAPPDLAGDVMAQVRREPQATAARTRRGLAARSQLRPPPRAALLAVGVGIAHAGAGGSSSSSDRRARRRQRRRRGGRRQTNGAGTSVGGLAPCGRHRRSATRRERLLPVRPASVRRRSADVAHARPRPVGRVRQLCGRRGPHRTRAPVIVRLRPD